MLTAPVAREITQQIARALPVAAFSALINYPAPAAGSATFENGLDSGWTLQPGTANSGSFDGFSFDGGHLVIAFPSGTSWDPGTTTGTAGLGAPRVESDAPAGDFTLDIKWASDPMLEDATYAGGGFVLQTASSSARMDFYMQDGTNQGYAYGKYAATTMTTSIPAPVGEANNLAKGWPPHQRLTRSGNVFTWAVSYDGETFSTVSSFTWAVTLTKVGVHAFQNAPAATGTTFRLEYVHLNGQAAPSIRDTVRRTPVLTETWDDLTAWSDDSAGTGGSASVSGNVLTLACGTADGSTGRILSNASYGEDQGVLLRARRTSALEDQVFLAVGLRAQAYGGQDWADEYAAPLAVAYEAALEGDGTRLVRVAGPGAPQGAKYTYTGLFSPTQADLDAWTWIRFETIGPIMRCRAWDDGNAEPETWDREVNIGLYGAGKVGIALSHNNGQAVTGSVEVDSLTIYEVS